MRHARAGKKLGRDSAHRKALYSNLAGALITHGRIQTTEAKAKAVKPFAEKMITLGKRGDLHARRRALAELRSQDVVHELFAEVAPRFAERPGLDDLDEGADADGGEAPGRGQHEDCEQDRDGQCHRASLDGSGRRPGGYEVEPAGSKSTSSRYTIDAASP